MRITRRSVVRSLSLASLTVGLTLVAGRPVVIAQDAHVLVPADKLQWGPAPPFLPQGAEIAVLEGNPMAKGAVVLRLRFPANYSIPAHWHTMAERITVLSGTFHVGMGDKIDKQASHTLEPGGFVSLPGKMHHFAWTATPTVVQLNLEGPFDIFYINASEDPQRVSMKK